MEGPKSGHFELVIPMPPKQNWLIVNKLLTYDKSPNLWWITKVVAHVCVIIIIFCIFLNYLNNDHIMSI
jgi:hypothetical protein